MSAQSRSSSRSAQSLATPAAHREAAAQLARARRDWELGTAHASAQDWSGAAAAFDRAARAAPQQGPYWIDLAHAWHRLGQPLRSLDAARRALTITPEDRLALRVVGRMCMQLHRYADAVAAFERFENAGHRDADVLLEHALALQRLSRPDEAVAVGLRALSLQPAMFQAHALLAEAFRERGLKQEAIECFRTMLALEPDNLSALARLCYEQRELLDWHETPALTARIQTLLQQLPPSAAAHTAPFTLLSLPLDPALQLRAARSESQALAQGVAPLPALRREQRPGPDARIRLGLLSFDFRDHPVAQLLVDVLQAFDRTRFELFLYSTGPDDGSALRGRLQQLADHFVDLRQLELADDQAAERIRADGIDLLLDLTGHTRGARMGILARRPAPVQAAYLGYPGSSGMAAVDYLIGDPLVTPVQLQDCYSEKLAQLPLCLLPGGSSRAWPQAMSRAAAGLPEDALVLCAFNHTYKISAEALDTWCGLLHELPQAVLWLKETSEQLQGHVRAAVTERGIDAARVVFAPRVDHAEHLSRLALADLFLDTWPYGAHTTAADALWAGVPVVTLYGASYASRIAASVLNAAGIGELAFDNVADYRCAILALALDPALRQTYREHLQSRRAELPLFDAGRQATDLMALCERMVERWRAGLPVEHLLAGDAGAPAGDTP